MHELPERTELQIQFEAECEILYPHYYDFIRWKHSDPLNQYRNVETRNAFVGYSMAKASEFKTRCRRCNSLVHFDIVKDQWVDDNKKDLNQYCWIDPERGSSLHAPIIG